MFENLKKSIMLHIKKHNKTKDAIEKEQKVEGGENMVDLTKISKHICILAEQDKIDEAIKLCEEHKDNPNIQLQHIKLLVKKQDYVKALRICNYYLFKDVYLIQYAKAKILYDLKRYKEALDVINNPIFENNEAADKLKEDIKIKGIMNDTISELYTRVYLDTITLSELDGYDIDEFEKLVLKILYYEKRKLPGILKDIKEAKIKYSEDKEKLRALNEFYSKFQSKKFLYINYSVYTSLLGVNLNDEMIEKHNSEKKYEVKPIKRVVLEPVKKEENKYEEYIPRQINRVHKVTKTKKPVQEQVKPVVEVVKKEKKPINLEGIKIKDVFHNEIIEIQKYLYVQMNLDQTKKTTDIWDRFSILIDKNVTDYKALSRFVEIATIINNISSYTTIDTELLNNKKIRYTKK
ncbi:MAG: hypothetical protein J6B98_05235 [Bacilli bacterium]|nr:hypothetical protein [Bacilli bacterium]